MDRTSLVPDRRLRGLTWERGRLFAQICLLEQPYVRDDKLTVGDLVTAAAAKTGERLVVRRFVRFRLGKE